MLVKLTSAAIHGIGARPVCIEVHLSRGIRFSLVGLPDNAVRESHERIVSALQVNGMDLPRRQIVINMAPADLRKEGTSYDLPLIVGIMAAGDYIPASSLEDSLFIGEISLDGHLQSVRGVLPIAILTRELGVKRLILPSNNAPEAAVVEGIEVYGMTDIVEVVHFLKNEIKKEPEKAANLFTNNHNTVPSSDFADVRGQENVKRAVEVACAGGHNLIMIGPPGAGKTMMANCIPGILPPMTLQESLETTKIHSVAGKTDAVQALLVERPFRAPHHSISSVALIGGGSKPQPGEVSLAHNGVLFLDELPEYQRPVLEVLRQPLEDQKIRIARANYAIDYPAGIMLVASMNPCPCGYYNHPDKPCVCTPGQIQKYLNRVSGPLIDRIDLQIEITPVSYEKLSERNQAESSETIRKRVITSRTIQTERFKDHPAIFCNARMSTREIRKFAQIDTASQGLLKTAMQRLNLSARAYDRILKVARTIADLDLSENIQLQHVAESIQYRTLDRENWGQ
ncbi:MAG: YifB family Mg chelatase-like AAA ATPase [Bacteroidales bacterium]|nr:YifB family Mg chelatase-like AAA ATPase [Bacteroidales bacterium]